MAFTQHKNISISDSCIDIELAFDKTVAGSHLQTLSAILCDMKHVVLRFNHITMST